MLKTYCTIFFLTLFLFTTNLFGQATNSYQFIEPNISISYDSNQYKKLNYLSNTAYEKEAYEFELKNDKKYKSNIYITANYPYTKSISKETIDSILYNQIDTFKKKKLDEFVLFNYDKVVRHIKDFSCIGIVLKHNKEDRYFIKIVCKHISIDDNTQIEFIMFNYKSLDSAYVKLQNFIYGFKSYSKKQITYEDSLIKASYTLKVYPTKNTTYDHFKGRSSTYLGFVKTKEVMKHKIKYVKINSDIFEKLINEKVPILCNDKMKGLITKQGELVVSNSFGKNVKLPFAFSYEND